MTLGPKWNVRAHCEGKLSSKRERHDAPPPPPLGCMENEDEQPRVYENCPAFNLPPDPPQPGVSDAEQDWRAGRIKHTMNYPLFVPDSMEQLTPATEKAAHIAWEKSASLRAAAASLAASNVRSKVPCDPVTRKAIPMARGLLDYFPDALMAVAHLSMRANEQHNPGEPMHWAREKSTDHADCIVRHLIDRGRADVDHIGHTVKVAWRALALLQEELEKTHEEIGR